MTRCTWTAAAVVALLTVAGCSGTDDGELGGATATDPAPTTVVQIATPQPPLPSDVNEVPFGLGQPAALGNLQVTLTSVDATAGEVALGISVRNGSLEPLTLSPDTFRLYFVDGSSVVLEDADGSTLLAEQIDSGATITGVLGGAIAEDGTPAMLLVDDPADDRILPGAFVLDEFTVVSDDS